MQLPGAGRRTTAALMAAATLAIATVSPAAERSSASAPKHASASAVTKPAAEHAAAPYVGNVSPRIDINAPANASIAPDPNFTPVSSPTTDEELLVQLVNVERTSRGLKPVVWDGMLSQLARRHDADMCAVGKASHHSSKDGADFGARLARTPYRARAAAENVAYNSDVVKAHRALMASPGHRHNILDPELTALGTAIVTEPGGGWIYVVEDFATPIAQISDSEAEQKMRESLARARGRFHSSLPEDKALSNRLNSLLERMIASGSVRDAVGGGIGEGWTLAFTSMDPATPPETAIAHAAKAEGYALAVSFRKTPRYPFGAYWAILFLKGVY